MDFTDFAMNIASAIDNFTSYLSTNFSAVFDFISAVVLGINGPLAAALAFIPAWAVIIIAVAGGVVIGRLPLAILSGLGLAFILALNLWSAAMVTLSLVLTAAFISLAIGIPLGT